MADWNAGKIGIRKWLGVARRRFATGVSLSWDRGGATQIGFKLFEPEFGVGE